LAEILIRLVVDTNVLVSAAIKTKSPPFLVIRWLEDHGRLLKSVATEEEALKVLARPHIASLVSEGFVEGLRGLLAKAECVHVREAITACRDPKDDKFLELAVNGLADVIVSGDADLLSMQSFRDIPIVTPANFMQALYR
jgi:putative PIN family toxin of toxin-antitoxin system